MQTRARRKGIGPRRTERSVKLEGVTWLIFARLADRTGRPDPRWARQCRRRAHRYRRQRGL